MDNREFESFNDIMNNVKLTILEHGYLNAGQDWQFYDLASPFNRIYFVIDGSGKIYNESNEVPIVGGKVYLVPIGQTFNYVCDNTLEMFYVHFRIELLAGHDLFDGYKYCVTGPIKVSEVQGLIDNARRSLVSDIITSKGLLYSHIGRFVEPFAESLIDHVKLKGQYAPVYEYIKKNCFADLRIKEIAKHLGMNPSTLSKGFRNSTGMTLKSYIDGKLIQVAQEQLLTTHKTIKDIAYEYRFSDEFHFSRFFKKHVGISPNKYRQRNNNYK